MNHKEIKPEQALMRLESLCARSEQCSFDIRRKLSAWNIPSATADNIIKQLIDNRFIDDQRFATAFCKDKVRFSRWGRVKITHALIQKRISKEKIASAIDVIDEQEYTSNLIDLLHSKAKTIENPDSYDGRTKLFRYAASRGFEPTLVINTIKNMHTWDEE